MFSDEFFAAIKADRERDIRAAERARSRASATRSSRSSDSPSDGDRRSIGHSVRPAGSPAGRRSFRRADPRQRRPVPILGSAGVDHGPDDPDEGLHRLVVVRCRQLDDEGPEPDSPIGEHRLGDHLGVPVQNVWSVSAWGGASGCCPGRRPPGSRLRPGWTGWSPCTRPSARWWNRPGPPCRNAAAGWRPWLPAPRACRRHSTGSGPAGDDAESCARPKPPMTIGRWAWTGRGWTSSPSKA